MVRKLDGSACTKVVCGEVRSEPCPFVGCMLARERERERGWSVGDDTQRSEEGRSLGFLWRRVGLDLRRIFVDFI